MESTVGANQVTQKKDGSTRKFVTIEEESIKMRHRRQLKVMKECSKED